MARIAPTYTLPDGTVITAVNTGDVDSGVNWDFGQQLQNAGYASLTNQGTIDYFNNTYGTNFADPLAYAQWLYGGGEAAGIGPNGEMLFKTPNGTQNTVNQPLSYDPQGFDFGDAVLLGGTALAGAGLTGMLPGTTNVFSGLSSAGNVLDGMDLSSGLTNFDAFDPTTLTAAEEGAGGLASNNSLMDAIVQATQGAVDSMPSSIPGPLGSLTNILSGNGGLTDWLKVGGAVAPSVLGYLGASKQADAFGNAQNQYLNLGAPYRSLLQNTFAPGYDISKEPGLQSAMDTAFNTYMRAASAGRAPGVSRGNPFDNPGAIMESQKYLLGNVALPYLQNTRNTLAAAGGLGVSQSVPFGTGGIQAQGGKYDAIGYGLGELLNPKPTGIILNDGQPFGFRYGSYV